MHNSVKNNIWENFDFKQQWLQWFEQMEILLVLVNNSIQYVHLPNVPSETLCVCVVALRVATAGDLVFRGFNP